MEIKIEISEEEIRDAVARKVRVAIADQTNRLRSDEEIMAIVKKHWGGTVDLMVYEELQNCDALKAKIVAEIERKLRNQIAAAMKAQTK